MKHEDTDDDDDDDDDDEDENYQAFNESYFTRIFEQEKMLSDRRRMNFYHAIIQKYVATSKKNKKVVLDVGTGTGVLAAWSSQAGASKVIAIDHSEKNVSLAATLADANGCNNIEFMVGHSSQFTCQQKVDVIVHEQIGDILFDECMVETICDLKERVLKPGGSIVPSQFSLFIEPVQLDDDRHISMVQNMTSHGIDFSCLQEFVETQDTNPDYYHFRSSDASIVDHTLTTPSSCWDVDLYTIAREEISAKTQLEFSRRVKHPGRMDALCVYFQCHDDELCITSGPSKDRCSHWGMRMLRVPEMWCSEGDELHIKVSVVESWEDLDSWRWSVVRNGHEEQHQMTSKDVTFLSSAELAALRGSSESNSVSNSVSSGSGLASKKRKKR